MIGKLFVAASAIGAAVYLQKPKQDKWEISEKRGREAAAIIKKHGGPFWGLVEIPPPPDGATANIDWLKKTYRVGTKVRLAYTASTPEKIPAGTIGLVTGLNFGHDGTATITIEFPVFIQLFLTSENRLVEKKYRFNLGKPHSEGILEILLPLDDNWGTLVPTVKPPTPIPQRGWARQAQASKSLRLRRP